MWRRIGMLVEFVAVMMIVRIVMQSRPRPEVVRQRDAALQPVPEPSLLRAFSRDLIKRARRQLHSAERQ